MTEQNKEQLEQEVQDLRDEVLFLRKLLTKMVEKEATPGPPGPQGPAGLPGISIPPIPYKPLPWNPNINPGFGGTQITCGTHDNSGGISVDYASKNYMLPKYDI